MLDTHRLRLLKEFAERGTIVAAATALGYTPSAVSQQLATLEREAGVALLDRTARTAELTDAGRRLAGHAERILALVEEAEADLAGREPAGRGAAGRPGRRSGRPRAGGGPGTPSASSRWSRRPRRTWPGASRPAGWRSPPSRRRRSRSRPRWPARGGPMPG